MGLYGDQFTDKVAIVTGAGGGIGQAYAEALAREGAAVVVADINTEGAQKVADGIKGEGGNALAVRVDVSDPDSAKEMAATALSEFGGITYSESADTWGYARAESSRTLRRAYSTLLQKVHELGVFAGFCYTQFSDTYQEANGLLFADRTPKFAIEAIHAATMGNPLQESQYEELSSSPRPMPPPDAT